MNRKSGAHAEGRSPRRAPRYRRGEPAVEQNGLKRSLSDWRIALRIARRSVLRTLGTSAVVVTMVALPVAGFSAAALVGESALPNPDERIAAELGQTEAKLYAYYPPDPTLKQNLYDPRWVEQDTDPDTGQPIHDDPDAVPVDPTTLFPADTEFIELGETSVTAETEGGKGSLAALVGPVWHEAFAGRFNITEGSAPSNKSEILVTGAALDRLGAKVGGEVEILEPEPRTVTVVGVLDDAMFPDVYESIYLDESAFSSQSESETINRTWYLTDTPLNRDELSRINKQGVTALSRAVLSEATALDLATNGSFWMQYGILLFLAAAFAIFEIVLLAGAAFAVGARKQQRSLATVASVGGGRRILYRIVTAQGLVLGLIGGLVGVAVGIPAGSLFMAVTADGSATQYWGFHLNALAMTLIVVVAAVVGLLSAIAPARAAVRFDVLSALRGSRKPPQANRTASTVGLVLLISGAVLTLAGAIVLRAVTSSGFWEPNPLFWVGLSALVVGPILAQVGIIKCGALVLRTIARLVPRRLGLGARLAARDSAAHPSRAVPAFAAIMVTAFLGVIVINLAVSNQRSIEVNYTHQIAPGKIQTWIPQDEQGEPTGDGGELVDVLSSTVDVDQAAVIERARLSWGWDDAAETGPTAWPSIPAENICPSNPDSTNYDAAVFDDPANSPGYAAAVKDLANDWRCAPDNYHLFGIGNNPILVAHNAAELELLLGKKPSTRAVEMLASGGAVSLWRDYIADDKLTISWWPEKSLDENKIFVASDDAVSSDSLPAMFEKPVVRLPFGVVISPETAAKLAIETQPSFVLASLETPPTSAQLDAATSALEPISGWPYYEKGPEDGSALWILGALGLCGILFLGASAVAIGLARADGRQDDATLTAVGATRMLRRNFAYMQALIIVGIGALAGTMAGLLVTWAISLMDTSGMFAFGPPWLALGALVVGMPLLIAAGSWLVASRPTTLAHRMAVG